MAKLPASLFNDVIGPVMRGPLSSHVIGARPPGALVRQSSRRGMSLQRPRRIRRQWPWPNPTGTARTSDTSSDLDIDLEADPASPDACAIAEREGVEWPSPSSTSRASHPNNYRKSPRPAAGHPSIRKPSP